jgi:hypothetical protein
VADDDAAVKAKMAALEAEVKADATAARARKDAALAKLRAQQEEQAELKRRQAELLAKKKPAAAPARARIEDDEDDASSLGGALELANRANKVRGELAKKPTKGEKSWVKSGIASMALGPIGWLYAGSLREAIPASAVWLALALTIGKILPTILLMPVLFVVLPLSGIAGVVYALQYNRHGGRQRLFDKKDEPKQLKGG